MNKLIFNEKTYIQNILQTHDKNILDINLFQLTQLIAIYLYQEYDIHDKDQLEKKINAELECFNFDGYCSLSSEMWPKHTQEGLSAFCL